MNVESEFLDPVTLNEEYSTSTLCMLRDKILEVKLVIERSKDLVLIDKNVDLPTSLELSHYDYQLAHIDENLRVVEIIINNRLIEISELCAGFTICPN